MFDVQLSDELYADLIQDLEQGDFYAEQEQFIKAIELYNQGIAKIPNPKTDWEVATHFYTALGDCYFNLQDYENAASHYNLALQSCDGMGNGYIWLGYGQSLYEMGAIEKAKEALISAFMLEGEEIFEDVQAKYKALIHQEI